MLIPMCWTIVVCLMTGVSVYFNCMDMTEEGAALFIAVLSIAFAFCALMLCLCCGM